MRTLKCKNYLHSLSEFLSIISIWKNMKVNTELFKFKVGMKNVQVIELSGKTRSRISTSYENSIFTFQFSPMKIQLLKLSELLSCLYPRSFQASKRCWKNSEFVLDLLRHPIAWNSRKENVQFPYLRVFACARIRRSHDTLSE